MVISFFSPRNLSRRLFAEASLMVILERASPRSGAELQAADGRNSRHRHPAGSQGLGRSCSRDAQPSIDDIYCAAHRKVTDLPPSIFVWMLEKAC
jgi:hypothetical protein